MSVGGRFYRPDTRVFRRTVQVRNPGYRTKTLSDAPTDLVFAASTAVTSVTGDFTELQPGWFIKNAQDGDHHYRRIRSITSANALVLEGAYAGTTGSGKTPAIKKASGRTLSPGAVGSYVNIGDLGFGQQAVLAPGAIQTVPLNTVGNVWTIRAAVASGKLEIVQQDVAPIRVGTTHKLWVQNLSTVATGPSVGDDLIGGTSTGAAVITAIDPAVADGATFRFWIEVDTFTANPFRVGEVLTADGVETMTLVDIEPTQRVESIEGVVVEITTPLEYKTHAGNVSGVSGLSINYTVTLPRSNTPSDITIQVQHLYSLDGGLRWSTATRLGSEGDDTGVTAAITPTVGGLARTFVWDVDLNLSLPATDVFYKILAFYDDEAFVGGTPDAVHGLTLTA
jgi:hypothetical protein